MIRRPGLIVALACVMLMTLAGQAFAGGVVVTLDKVPSDVQPGQPFDVGFMILSAHNGQAVSGQQPVVELIDSQTQEVIRQTGRPDGIAGHYVATLTLPGEGEWRWSIQPFADSQGYPASELTPLQVKAVPAAVAVAPAQAVPVRQPGAFQMQPMGQAAAGFALLVLIALAFALRGRLRVARS